MEQVLNIKTVSTTGHNYGNNKFALVRYADDFLVFSDSKENCETAKKLLEPWLMKRGLEFSPEKVHIRNIKEGVKFLGCQIKLYGKEKPRLLIKPHPKEVQRIRTKIKSIFLKLKGQSPFALIRVLNPIIRG